MCPETESAGRLRFSELPESPVWMASGPSRKNLGAFATKAPRLNRLPCRPDAPLYNLAPTPRNCPDAESGDRLDVARRPADPTRPAGDPIRPALGAFRPCTPRFRRHCYIPDSIGRELAPLPRARSVAESGDRRRVAEILGCLRQLSVDPIRLILGICAPRTPRRVRLCHIPDARRFDLPPASWALPGAEFGDLRGPRRDGGRRRHNGRRH